MSEQRELAYFRTVPAHRANVDNATGGTPLHPPKCAVVARPCAKKSRAGGRAGWARGRRADTFRQYRRPSQHRLGLHRNDSAAFRNAVLSALPIARLRIGGGTGASWSAGRGLVDRCPARGAGRGPGGRRARRTGSPGAVRCRGGGKLAIDPLSAATRRRSLSWSSLLVRRRRVPCCLCRKRAIGPWVGRLGAVSLLSQHLTPTPAQPHSQASERAGQPLGGVSW